jgi:hypothetical protein
MVMVIVGVLFGRSGAGLSSPVAGARSPVGGEALFAAFISTTILAGGNRQDPENESERQINDTLPTLELL